MVAQPELVIPAAASFFGIPQVDIESKRRDRRIVDVRMAVTAYMRSMGVTFLEIGNALGGKDTSSTQLYMRNHATFMGNNKVYRAKYEAFVAHLEGGMG
jgi:chromosomal replication initiation ATPase DnaA